MEELIKVQELEGKLHITTPYSEEFIAKIKKVRGAKWDSTNKVWTTPCEEKKVVYKILDDLFCYKGDQTAYKRFRLKAIDKINAFCGAVCLGGFEVVSAKGRDSGTRWASYVTVICDRSTSGGSIKNWATIILQGCIFELYLPSTFFVEFDYSQEYEIKQIEDDTGKADEAAAARKEDGKLKSDYETLKKTYEDLLLKYNELLLKYHQLNMIAK